MFKNTYSFTEDAILVTGGDHFLSRSRNTAITIFIKNQHILNDLKQVIDQKINCSTSII